jgi:hypothetical protein
MSDKEQGFDESFMEKHKLRESCRKREGCWLQSKKIKSKCKGEKIPFPLMSKGGRKGKRLADMEAVNLDERKIVRSMVAVRLKEYHN